MTEESLFIFLFEWYRDLTRADDPFSVWDCYSEMRNVYIELKCRRTHYEQLLIEKSKYDRLSAAAAEKSMIPLYICSTPLGIWGFSLPRIQVTWEDKEMPVTTDFENQRKIIKTVGFLDISTGYQFT
jgi:hypothetical protein